MTFLKTWLGNLQTSMEKEKETCYIIALSKLSFPKLFLYWKPENFILNIDLTGKKHDSNIQKQLSIKFRVLSNVSRAIMAFEVFRGRITTLCSFSTLLYNNKNTYQYHKILE